MKRKSREWLEKADDDFRLAEQLVLARPAFHDQVCFHAQQAVEKYLKAILEQQGQFIPKTHDLEDLMSLLLTNYPNLRKYRRSFGSMTEFAVTTRYPGTRARKRQAVAAVKCATRVRDECRAILGIRPRPKKN